MERLRERLVACRAMTDILQKQLTVASIICDAYNKYGVTPVVVGGLAVEFYSLANYLTRDIDMIVPGDEHTNEVMLELGFTKRGSSTWFLQQDPTIIVDFPASPLAGSWDKVIPVEMEAGHVVYIIAVEDIIIDRILAIAFWNDPEEWAQFIMAAHYDDIDWEYCERRAKEEDCREIFTKAKTWADEHRKDLHIADE